MSRGDTAVRLEGVRKVYGKGAGALEALRPTLTVEQNVTLPLRLAGRRAKRAAVQDVLAIVATALRTRAALPRDPTEAVMAPG